LIDVDMKTILKDGQTVLFYGDSITACHREPEDYTSLGQGFVSLFANRLLAREPEKNIRVLNQGIGGNTVQHLLTRCYDDVIDLMPDYVFILIGINDVVRYMDSIPSLHASPEKYKETYAKLIQELQYYLPATRIILMEPFYLSRGIYPQGTYREQLFSLLQQYIDRLHEVSAEMALPLIKLSECFQHIFEYQPSALFSADKIHPNIKGHMIIAEAVFQHLFKGKDHD